MLDDWLAAQKMSYQEMHDVLLAHIVVPVSDFRADVHGCYLSVAITGAVRTDTAGDWKVTFQVTSENGEYLISSLFIQAYSGLTIEVQDLTAQLLRNVVRFAIILGIKIIKSSAIPGNSMGYLRAGFLPWPQSWPDLKYRLTKELLSLGAFPNEPNASTAIGLVLAAETPAAMRQLLQNAGIINPVGALYPLTCSALLKGSGTAWSGSLNLGDPESYALFMLF